MLRLLRNHSGIGFTLWIHAEAFLGKPVVDVVVDELVLGLSLHHTVALLSQPPNHAEGRQLGLLREWVSKAFLVQMQVEDCLL